MKSGMESKTSSPVVIGIDIGKDVIHLVGFAADGKIAFKTDANIISSRASARLTPYAWCIK